MKYLWYPLCGLKWVGIKIRTLALMCTRARVVARTPEVRAVKPYLDHLHP